MVGSTSKTVVVSITGIYSDMIDRLRVLGFLGGKEGATDTGRWMNVWDALDHQSLYIVAAREGDLVACGRLTPGGVLTRQWTGRQTDYLPRGANVLELSRFVTDDKWRGIGLYGLLIACSLSWAYCNGYTAVNCLLEPDLPEAGLFRRLGFQQPSLKTLLSDDLPGKLDPVPVIALTNHLEREAVTRTLSERARTLKNSDRVVLTRFPGRRDRPSRRHREHPLCVSCLGHA